jgi:hypothetical protein
MTFANPPGWAEQILRMVLPPIHRETVSGDLLELYRDDSYHARRLDRDVWYVTEVVKLVWQQNRLWIGLLSTSMLARTVIDWFVPTSDFHARAFWSTMMGVGLAIVVGFVSGWRARSVVAAGFSGFATFAAAASVHTIGALVLIGGWHGPETLEAIRQSGGIAEAFTLPMMLTVPGGALGALAGGIAQLLRAIED